MPILRWPLFFEAHMRTALEIAGMMIFAFAGAAGLLVLTHEVPWLGALAIIIVVCACASLFADAPIID